MPVAPLSAVVGERFRLLALLGAGGMGSVYRARDMELDETIALKLLRSDLRNTPGAVERFRQEVRLSRRITHPNIARVFDIGTHEGNKFLTMEFIDGEPLRVEMLRTGPFSVSRALAVAAQLCAGLEAAHAAGVLHRDLKPDNVLLCWDGRVVLTDFGIARALAGEGVVTQSRAPVGTPAYMSPEQLSGGSLDAASDLYSLGVLLFEMLTGERPFRGENLYALLAARLQVGVPDPRRVRPELPEAVCAVVRRCLANEPGARYSRASEVAAALAEAGRGAQQTEEVSVIVLPFVNEGSASDAYLASGLGAALLDMLSSWSGLRVKPRPVQVHWNEGSRRAQARALGVSHVITGGARREGGQVRARLRLLHAKDPARDVVRELVRPAEEYFSLVAEMGKAIAASLSLRLVQALETGTHHPEALDLYLRARHEEQRLTVDSLHKAASLSAQALALSPDEPTILAGYAVLHARVWNTDIGADPSVARKAETAAGRALSLAPRSAEPHLALSILRGIHTDWPGAATSLREALRLSPLPRSEIHLRLGQLLLECGELARAEEAFELVLALEPFQRHAYVELSRLYALQGEFGRAHALLRASLEKLGESFIVRTSQIRFAGWQRLPPPVFAIDALPERATPSFLLLVRMLKGYRPNQEERQLLQRETTNQEPSRQELLFSQVLAELAQYDGRSEEALSHLERAAQRGLLDLSWLDRCPLFTEFHSHASFVKARALVEARVRIVRDILLAPGAERVSYLRPS
jgi:serine/threonine-protein kinase